MAGQFAGAQAVLHGQRFSHVGHRLVDLLQITLVLHLQAILADCEVDMKMNISHNGGPYELILNLHGLRLSARFKTD